MARSLESIQQGLPHKVTHDESPGSAALVDRPLQGFVHPDVHLYLSHLVFLGPGGFGETHSRISYTTRQRGGVVENLDSLSRQMSRHAVTTGFAPKSKSFFPKPETSCA